MDANIEPSFRSTEIKAPESQGKKFWPRAGAYLVDVFAIYGLNYLAYSGFGIVIGMLLALIPPLFGISYSYVDANTTCMNYILGFAQTVVYFTLFEWLFSRSIGKIVFSMRVVSSDGNSCSLKQAFTRAVYRLVDGLLLGIVANSYMKPPVYQRLGDQKALTLVVASKDPFIKDNPPWWKFFVALVIYMAFEFPIVVIGIMPFIRFTW